jgi:hypothetical protein
MGYGQHSIAAFWIGVGPMPAWVGVQMQTVTADPPPPGLRVMD